MALAARLLGVSCCGCCSVSSGGGPLLPVRGEEVQGTARPEGEEGGRPGWPLIESVAGESALSVGGDPWPDRA